MRRQKLLGVVAVITMSTLLFTGCVAKIPEPTVEEGRFEFSVTYEIDGEEKTCSGVYVCQYEGVSVALDGKGRAWNACIENGSRDGMIEIQNNEDGKVFIDLKFNPMYFMADPNAILFETPEPELVLVYHSDDPDIISFSREVDFYAEYGVKLVSYTYADPIENSYVEKWSIGNFDMGIN